jgi:hypothetical protein
MTTAGRSVDPHFGGDFTGLPKSSPLRLAFCDASSVPSLRILLPYCGNSRGAVFKQRSPAQARLLCENWSLAGFKVWWLA